MKLWLPVYLPGQLDEWHEAEARERESRRKGGEQRGGGGGKVKDKEEEPAIDVNL